MSEKKSDRNRNSVVGTFQKKQLPLQKPQQQKLPKKPSSGGDTGTGSTGSKTVKSD